MKHVWAFAFVLFALMLIYGCSQAQEKPESPSPAPQTGMARQEAPSGNADFLTYENPEYGVKIGYPADWQARETGQVIVAFLAPKTGAFQDNLNLVMNDLSGQGLTISAYNEIAVGQLKQTLPDIEFVESGSATLSNNPAYKVVYTTSGMKIMQEWTIKKDIAYVWTYTSKKASYENNLDSVQKMLGSFEITRDITAKASEDSTMQAPKDSGAQRPVETKAESAASAEPALVGSWRALSERIFYDLGGAGSAGVPVTRNLELLKDGTWQFGDSKGTWSVADITAEDWARWGISSYGPVRMITLGNWNKASADGPIEESSAAIDYIWAIYHVEPPAVQNAGTVWIKFGRS